MRINASPKNTAAIDAALEAVQSRARVRTLTAQDVISAGEQAEKELEAAGIPKKHRVGSIAYYEPHSVPASYGYSAGATSATLVRGHKDWFVTEITRARLYGTSSPSPDLVVALPRGADHVAILRHLLSAHGIRISEGY